MSGQPEQIILVGGPHNGKTMTIPGMPSVWRMPDTPKPTTLYEFDETTDLAPLDVFDYHLVLDGTGWPARRDDGRLAYELSPHRQAAWLEEQRQADMPPIIVGYRLRFDHPDPTARLAWPVAVVCNCGATLGVASDITELEALLVGPGAEHSPDRREETEGHPNGEWEWET